METSGNIQKRTVDSTRGAASIILLPWITFVAWTCALAFGSHVAEIFLKIVFFVSLAYVFIVIFSIRDDASRLYCALLSLLAMMLAYIVANVVSNGFFVHYWYGRDSHAFTNVMPSDNAASYADAGMLVFNEEARLDPNFAMGYKDGIVYCVAPILDDQFNNQQIQFWAVGEDCCAARGNFVCDDAWNDKAHSALVLHDVGTYFFPSMYDEYMKAVKQAEAAYELSSAEKPIMVRWLVDPEQVQHIYWSGGVGIVCVACAIYLLISVFFYCCLFAGTRRKAT